MFTNRKSSSWLSSLLFITALLFAGVQPVPVFAQGNSGLPEIPALAGVTWYVATTGNDSNSCTTAGDPCLTINGAIGKAADGDTIKVAVGTYTGNGTEVVLIDKGITLSGGWSVDFTAEDGISTINGQASRRGITVNSGVITTIEWFVVQNGTTGSDYGGGIKNSGILTLNYSIVSGNHGRGGGIANFTGVMTLNNSTVGGNSGSGAGGIFNWGQMTLNNSTVNSNLAYCDSSNCGYAGYGGGIYSGGFPSGGTLVLNNSTVSGNTASGNNGYGGGIYNQFGTVILNNSTISDNTSKNGGGGIYPNAGTVTLMNTLLAGNSAAGDGQDCSYSIESAGYNLIGNTSGCNFAATTGDLVGTSTSPINPGLAPLQDNGGPTFTHALMVGSPAINAGNPATPGGGGNACLATDQRGISRPVSTACNIGAFEGEVPTVFIDISGNAGVAGAFLNYIDGTPKSAIADGSGNYSFTVPSSWSGTVTPSKSDYAFSPVNRVYNNVFTNQTSQSYSATAYLVITGNVGVAGATLSYMDGTPKTATADGDGVYSFKVPSGWSGTVTPSKAGITFTPANRTYSNLIADQTSQNYSASFVAFMDPSFEAYTPNPYWAELSTNFWTPLCTVADCGNGAGTALPRTGSVWGWFGGIQANEIASLSQSIIIPSGVPDLKLQFYFWIGSVEPGSDAADVFTAKIDGVTVFSANATQQSSYPAYTPILVDISSFGDGASHTISFSSSTTDQGVTFNLDDISLTDVTFFDVPSDYWSLSFIETLVNSGITSGCGNGNYCPENPVTRAQMAVFLLKGIHGSSYAPPTVGASTGFNDVATDYWAAAWIKQLAAESITGGCGGGLYCPDNPVTRAQMAVFLLKAKYGSAYAPPVIGSDSGFTDVAVDHWAAAWIKQLAAEGITSGCAAGVYCPETAVNRAQMAVFLVKTFNLP